ncbi:MAG TPA: chromate transporter [Dehalococcoidia bacterium]|nr:chromate transporter [Dehalococcoidia bacterium]
MSADDLARPTPRVPWRQLLPVVAVIGLTSLGGGRFAYYHDAMVQKRGWLTDDDFLEGLTLSQLIPGPTFANFTVFVSQRLGGWIAGVIGLALILTPGAAAMLALSVLYDLGVTRIPLADAAFKGIGAAAAGLTLVMLIRLVQARSGIPNLPAIAVAIATFVALGPLQMSMLAVVPPLAVVGLWLNRPRSRPAA